MATHRIILYILFMGVHKFSLRDADFTDNIEIPSGIIKGITGRHSLLHRRITMYLGVPYAKAERFERPVAPDSWEGVRRMTSPGKVCYQPPVPAPFNYSLDQMSEDCLNLNIYVPERESSDALLPVMVWIHGGGFFTNSNHVCEGSALATLGKVIVVVINYRLGLFGFLASQDYDLEGNYGLYDQVEALKWVRDNINKFGGDPSKVTIFGNSAGGISVSILSMSPLARGLFKYAIMQSGVASMPIGYYPYKDKTLLKKFAETEFGCTDEANMKQCLKEANATDFLNAMQSNLLDRSFFNPAIDGQFLTENPLDMVQNADTTLNPERVMIGIADDDGSCITDAIPVLSLGFPIFSNPVTNKTSLMDYLSVFRAFFTNVNESQHEPYVEAIANNYFTATTNFTNTDHNTRIILDVLKDAVFYAPGVAHANSYVTRNVPTYFYEVKYGLKVPYFDVPPILNGYHETEKFMEFGFMVGRNDRTGDAISRDVIRMWSNFAKTGDPNSPDTSTCEVQWPQYNLSQKQHLVIKPAKEVQSNVRSQQMAVWNTILPSLGQGSASSANDKNSIFRDKNKKKMNKKKKKKNPKKQKAKQSNKPKWNKHGYELSKLLLRF